MSTDVVTYSNTTSLQPRDLGEAMTIAETLAKSGLVPYALRGKPADVLIIIMYGMELGLSINQALNGINVIKGRPSLSADLRVAKTRERGHRVGVVCVECGEWADEHAKSTVTYTTQADHKFVPDQTKERCTVKAVRKDTGETAIVTWTVEDAIDAGRLWYGKGDLEGKLIARSANGEVLPWESSRKDMLYHRASDRACKAIAPEVAFGLYTREEIEGMPDEPVRVTAEVGEPVTADAIRRDAAAARLQAAEHEPEHEPVHEPESPVVAQDDDELQVTKVEYAEAEHFEAGPGPAPAAGPGDDPITSYWQRRLHANLREAGKSDRTVGLKWISETLGREVASTRELTINDARTLVSALEALKDGGESDDPGAS